MRAFREEPDVQFLLGNQAFFDQELRYNVRRSESGNHQFFERENSFLVQLTHLKFLPFRRSREVLIGMAISQSIERKTNDRSNFPALQSPERSFYPAKLDSQIPTGKYQGPSHDHYYRKESLRRIAPVNGGSRGILRFALGCGEKTKLVVPEVF